MDIQTILSQASDADLDRIMGELQQASEEVYGWSRNCSWGTDTAEMMEHAIERQRGDVWAEIKRRKTDS